MLSCAYPLKLPIYIIMAHADPELTQALAHAQQQEKVLNRITWCAAVILALFATLFVANQNLWSVTATFIIATTCFIAGSIYRIFLGWLLITIALFCLADNYLSHQQQFHQPHFLLQFATLVVFTAIFSLSRPYLYKALSSIHKT